MDLSDKFKEFLDSFVHENWALGFEHINSGIDVQAITYFYADVMGSWWTHISPDFQCIPWKNRPIEGLPYLFHYFNIKLWVAWWASAAQAYKKHPELLTVIVKDKSDGRINAKRWQTGRCFWCNGWHDFIDFETNPLLCIQDFED